MNRRIDLSCDLGESRTAEERAVEIAIWPLITSANVACGGHVGDESSMKAAIDRCREHDVALGAHPSYPDREGFGRRTMAIDSDDLIESLASQLESLRRLGIAKKVELERVKPHGALYNEAQGDARLAAAIVEAVRRVAPHAAVVCADGSEVQRACLDAGIAVVREAFADRRYMPDGSLQPRSEEGSLLLNPKDAVAQALRLAQEGRVTSAGGTSVEVVFETMCAHSDMEGSVQRIGLVRSALTRAGFAIGRR